MKTFRTWLCLGLLATAGHIRVHAAILVGTNGTGTLTFGSLPAATEWATSNPGGASSNITTFAALDAAAQTNVASRITTPLGQSPTVSPSISDNALARWNSANLNLQTVPTDVAYTLLMVTLQNNTGATASGLQLSYTLGLLFAAGSTVEEQIPGHRVFYSLTGAAQSWVLIPEFSTGTPGALSATLSLGTWPVGARLYLLWVDDNAAADRNHSGTEEGAYTIDNFAANALIGSQSSSLVTPLRLASTTNGFELAVGPVLLPGRISVYRSAELATLTTNLEVLFQTNTPLPEPLRLPVTNRPLDRQAFFRTQLLPEPAVIVAETNIPSSGGKIVVPPGSPIAGLVLDVPANSYPTARAFSLSYTPLGDRRLSDFATPITPLINVDNGGGLAGEFMALTLPPVNLAPNEIVVASLLSHDAGIVSYVPVFLASNGTMTILTRHFSSAVFEKILTTIVTPIETGFRPGRDDWDFQSLGTFAEPNGSCYAWSQSAIWYFKHKRSALGQLYNHFDSVPHGFPTPDITQDNVRGIRFAGVLQRLTTDFEWDIMAKRDTLFKWYGWSHVGTFWACYLQMKRTHEPQLIALSGAGGHHAVVAYAADNNYIYTADSLKMSAEDFGYLARNGRYTDAVGDSESYTNPYFIADTLLADATLLPTLWSQVERGTIGRAEFPTFQAAFYQEQAPGQPVQVGTALISPADPVNAPITNHTAQIAIDVFPQSGPPAFKTEWTLYSTNGHILGGGTEGSPRPSLALNLGTNLVGIRVKAAPEPAGDRSEAGWAGFAWITILREGVLAPVALPATDIRTNGFTANWQSVPGADGYAIDVATNQAFANCLYTNYTVGNGTNVSLSGLSFQPATDYYYRLRASRGTAWTTNSNVISVRTLPVSVCDCPLTSYLVPVLVDIPAGTFTMGSPASEPARYDSEGPQTTVRISRAFKMGKYEVTQAEYQSVMEVNPSYFPGDLSRPVEQVSWYDASNYCCRVTACEQAAGRLPAGYVYRLPTEAEWEYACRAGTTTRFHYGNELRSGMANFDGYYEYPPCGGSTWYCPNPSGIDLGRTTSVGSYAPNAWGLCDMHGNVVEYCQDWWTSSLPGGSVTDPQGSATGYGRMLRGGGWGTRAHNCRSATRYAGDPTGRYGDVGFRVVLAPGQ